MAADAVLENFEAAAFYNQWLRDVADTQTYLNGAQFHYLNGSVPDCVVSRAPSTRPPARPPARLCPPAARTAYARCSILRAPWRCVRM